MASGYAVAKKIAAYEGTQPENGDPHVYAELKIKPKPEEKVDNRPAKETSPGSDSSYVEPKSNRTESLPKIPSSPQTKKYSRNPYCTRTKVVLFTVIIVLGAALIIMGYYLAVLLAGRAYDKERTTENPEESEDSSIKVRLVGGNRIEGRVEVLYQNVWRGVCDDKWDDKDAMVVCRMLGLSGGRALQGSDIRYGESQQKAPFWLDDLECSGNETNIASCSHSEWGVDNCGYEEAAKVMCTTENLQVRLVGGNSTGEGRVEVQYKGEWRGVCDDKWDNRDARVVCQMLGLSGGIALPGGDNRFGQPSKASFWIDDLDCDGCETNIARCRQSVWGMDNCETREAAKIICSTRATASVRVVDSGGSSTSGLVEVYYQGEWRAICVNGWSNSDARVVCRMLGLGGGTAHSRPTPNRMNFWLDGLECYGCETSITLCNHKGWGVTSCGELRAAGITCTPKAS